MQLLLWGSIVLHHIITQYDGVMRILNNSQRISKQVRLLGFQQVRGQRCPRTDAYRRRTSYHF